MQLILGSSGSGKSYRLYKQLINESISNIDTNYIIIVPEQFNMQAQKDIINMHPNHGVTNIDILSFTRLAYRVFEEVGGSNKTILEETGKSMVLRKVVELKKKELGLFSGNIKKAGFISQLKALISELYQYNIDNNKLSLAINNTKTNPVLNNKLKDIYIIYDAFRNYLSDKFITNEEILDILSENIHKSNIIKNSIIYLDSFISFTPSQYRLLEELMKYSKSVVAAITIDTTSTIYKVEEDYKLFYMSQKTISKLLDIANITKTKREQDILIKDNYRFKNSAALSSLEKNLFRYPYKVYKSKQDDISIHITKNPNNEIQFISKEILKLVRDKDYQYKDIAVVMGDISIYADIIQKTFDENNIPFFIDNKKSILSNPFIEFIRSALEVIIKDFSYESVFRYLKSGLTGIEREDIDILENYVMALGIRGNSVWKKKWSRKYKSVKEVNFERINSIRKTIIESFTPLRTALKTKDANIKQYTVALWEFVLSLGIENKLNLYKLKFSESKQLILSKQYDQIYKVVVEVLDKIVELLGDEVVSIQEYSNILDAGFEEAKIGLIPPSIDQLTVGDIGRTRLTNIKALFFAGVNDGIIPRIDNAGHIISDIEKEILLENGLEMSPTGRQNAYAEKFYLYSNLTKPSEKLYISFSTIGLDGKSLRQSYLINTIQKLFSEIDIIDEEQTTNVLDSIYNKNSATKYLADGLRNYTNENMALEWKELYSYYYNNNELKPKLESLIDAAFYTNKEFSLSKSVAVALYGKELTSSITRLEKYAACSYAHFLDYGLELSERQSFKFTAPDIGNILHKTIELFSTKLAQYKMNWDNISDSFRNELVDACIIQTIKDYGDDILKDSARNSYMINRINRIAKRTIWALQEQIKRGNFTPSQYEIQFSNIENLNSINIALSEDERLKLQGRIDRLDKCEDENSIYIKIIDYKSGSTDFNIVAVYYGLQLQLVAYMNAAIELEQKQNDKNIVPAGIFYYNIDDPIIDIDEKGNLIAEEINQEILKNLRMNGLINSDKDIIKLVDKNFDKKSEVIDDNTRKKAVSNKEFRYLSEYINKKIITFGKEILNGNIEINPYKLKDKTACQYCKYNCICGFDTKIDGNNYRKLRDYKPEEVWEKIEQDVKRNESDNDD